MSTETPDRPWLAELTERYGKPRVTAGPSRQWDDSGNFTRECWVWFPGNVNHHVGLDRLDKGDGWRVKAGRHDGLMAEVTYRGRPTDAQVRDVLADVQILPPAAPHPAGAEAEQAVMTARTVTGIPRPDPEGN
jgi:hypothetical protein